MTERTQLRTTVAGMGASESQTTDRRCAPRRPLHTRVALKTEKAIFFMESLDVSTSGIRLQSEVNIEIGTRCRLVPFFDDVTRLFEANGTVVRLSSSSEPVSRPSDAGRSDLGIQFDTLSQAELDALLAILRTADAPPVRMTRM